MAETLRSSAGVSQAVLTSRVLGVARDSLFAAVFGASALTDAYRVAFMIPNLLRDLFAEGALSSAFVPTFTDALVKDGKERAFALGNRVMVALLLVTGALVVVGIVFAAPLVGLISGGFAGDAAKLAATIELARIMMPILALVSVSAAWMGMLNAQRRYLAPAYAPALFNVVSIAAGGALLAAALDQASAMVIFAAATTLAALAQAVCQLPALWRLGYRPHVALAGVFSDPGVRRVGRLMAPAVIGLAAIQLNVFVNTRFAAALGDGPATYLGNAFRIFYLPIGVFGVALATVTTVRVSEEAARGDRAALVDRTREGARSVWLLALPSAVGLCLLARPTVALLFQYGRFTAEDVDATAAILQAYVLGVVPYSLIKVFAPAFYTLDRPRIPMIASMIAVAVNVGFNVFTYRRLGAPGLALGTTLGALANLLVLRVAYGRLVGSLAEPGLGRRMMGLTAAAVVLLGAVAACGVLAERAIVAADLVGTGRRVAEAASLFGAIAIGFAVYVSICRAVRYPGADELARLPSRLLARFRRR